MTIILIASAILLIIACGLIARRLWNEKDFNEGIYQEETKTQEKSLNEELSIDLVKESEGEETELTMKDLEDSDDNIFHSHMSW